MLFCIRETKMLELAEGGEGKGAVEVAAVRRSGTCLALPVPQGSGRLVTHVCCRSG